MPNHITNILIVSGPRVDLERFRIMVSSENPVLKAKLEKVDERTALDFNGTVPMPEFKDDDGKQSGMPGWYDWSCDNWGTKWNAYDAVDPILTGFNPPLNEAEIQYQFNTAWSPPAAWIITTAKMFPTLNFNDDWIDEGGGSGVLNVKDEDVSDQQQSDHDWRMKNDSNYADAYAFILNGEYKEVIEQFTASGENDFWDLDEYLFKRIKKKDLPLFVNYSWANDVQTQYENAIKGGLNEQKKKAVQSH